MVDARRPTNGEQDTAAVKNSDGVIVLNLTPVVNSLLAEGSDFLSDLLGRDINAPVVADDNIDAAVAVLEEQLDTDLPPEFRQVTRFASDDLATAQAWYQTIRPPCGWRRSPHSCRSVWRSPCRLDASTRR